MSTVHTRRGCQIDIQGPQLCAKPHHFCKLDVATSRMAFLDLFVLQVATSNSNNWGRSVVQNCTANTDKIKLDIFQNFVAFSEYMNFKEHKIIMANARKVLSRRRKYVAQAWHCYSGFGQTSRLPKVISCLLHLSCSWHQTTNLAFPNYFHEFLSVWENKHFIGPKLRKVHGKQNWLLSGLMSRTRYLIN